MSDRIGRQHSVTRFSVYNALDEDIRCVGPDGRVLMVNVGTEPAWPRTIWCAARAGETKGQR